MNFLYRAYDLNTHAEHKYYLCFMLACIYSNEI